MKKLFLALLICLWASSAGATACWTYVGSTATWAGSTGCTMSLNQPSANVLTLLGAANYAAFISDLSLTVGTNVQAYNANLTTYAGIAPSANAQTLLGETFGQMLTSLGAQANMGITGLSGNTYKVVTEGTTPTGGYCAQWDSSGNLTSASAACGSGGSMTYPSGTGVAVVTSGTSWGTTLTPGHAASNLLQLDSSGNANIPTGASYQINGTNVIGGGSNGSYGVTLTNNTSFTPGSVDQILFLSNVFQINQNGTLYSGVIGPSAGQVTIAGPTAARTVTFPDAAFTVAKNDGSNLTFASQAVGDLAYATSTTAYGRLGIGAAYSFLRTNSGATAPQWSTATIDDSTSNVTKLANGTSSLQIKAGQALNFTGTFTDGDVCTYTASGSVIGCNTSVGGGGNVSNSGTPTQYQWPQWASATTLTGNTVTASKVVCSGTNSVPQACTNLTDTAIPTGTFASQSYGSTAVGDILIAGSSGVPTGKLADVATGSILVSGGVATAPAYATAIPSGVTATTQSAGDDSTKLATTAYMDQGPLTVVETSGSPLTVPAKSGVYWNNSGAAYSFDLPTPTVGLQFCFGSYRTAAYAISVIPPASTYIVYKGVLGTAGSATGIVSGGAAGDQICLVADSTTSYEVMGAGQGTWTNH